MSLSRPIQWYHSHADLIWPEGTFNCLQTRPVLTEKLLILPSEYTGKHIKLTFAFFFVRLLEMVHVLSASIHFPYTSHFPYTFPLIAPTSHIVIFLLHSECPLLYLNLTPSPHTETLPPPPPLLRPNFGHQHQLLMQQKCWQNLLENI